MKMIDQYSLALLRKLPMLDVTWPEAVQDRWFRVFRWLLWRHP
jgi:hypothetical protein